MIDRQWKVCSGPESGWGLRSCTDAALRVDSLWPAPWQRYMLYLAMLFHQIWPHKPVGEATELVEGKTDTAFLDYLADLCKRTMHACKRTVYSLPCGYPEALFLVTFSIMSSMRAL